MAQTHHLGPPAPSHCSSQAPTPSLLCCVVVMWYLLMVLVFDVLSPWLVPLCTVVIVDVGGLSYYKNIVRNDMKKKKKKNPTGGLTIVIVVVIVIAMGLAAAAAVGVVCVGVVVLL